MFLLINFIYFWVVGVGFPPHPVFGYLFLGMWVCCLCVCLCIMWVQFPQRPGEGSSRKPGSAVTESCEPVWVLGTQHRSSAEQQILLTNEPSFHSLTCVFISLDYSSSQIYISDTTSDLNLFGLRHRLGIYLYLPRLKAITHELRSFLALTPT